jgi:Zn-finger nucleic acid-binding protein
MLSLHLPADVTPRDVAKMMQMPGEIEVKDRSTFFNKYPNCFVAKEAVSWLVKRNLSRSRDDAVNQKENEKKKKKKNSFFFEVFFFFAIGRRGSASVSGRFHLQRVARQRLSRQRPLLFVFVDYR